MLLILFTVLFRFLTQIADSFAEPCNSWETWNPQCSSNVRTVFFKQLCHITFKIRPIIVLEYLWVFKHTTLLMYCFQHKWNLTCFLGPKSFSNLYLDTTSTPVNICLYVFPSKTLWGTKNIKLILFIRFCHCVIYFLKESYVNLPYSFFC